MSSVFKKSALGLALAVAAIASNAPAQARDTYQRDNGNAYSQVRHDDRGNRSERHRHLTRRDEYRIRNHHNGGGRITSPTVAAATERDRPLPISRQFHHRSPVRSRTGERW